MKTRSSIINPILLTNNHEIQRSHLMKQSLDSGNRPPVADWKSLISTAAVLLAMTGNTFAAATFVNGLVPDWNQPYRYVNPNGPGADPAPNIVNQWNDWCAPCSGANLAGHWADARGIPVADATSFPNSTLPWAAPSWQDYLADGTVNRPLFPPGPLPAQTTDIGWYMNANLGVVYDAGGGLSMGGFPFVPPDPPHSGTYLGDIHAGLQNYLNDRYSAAGSIFWKTGTRGKAFTAGTDPAGNPAGIHPNAASAFGEVMSEINSNRTLIISFKHWNITQTASNLPPVGSVSTESGYGGSYFKWSYTPSPGPNNDENEEWDLGTNSEALGHAVTVVGYIPAGSTNDLGPQLGLGPTDWVIVHDNWASTPRNVIIPFDFANNWVANVTAVPWPAATLFVNGLVPDWNQPYEYSPQSQPPGPNGGPTYPNINNPVPFGFVDQWSDWCGPASAANLAGHWMDHHNTPVADNTAFSGSDVMWAVGPSWQDYLADGTATRPAPTNGPPPAPTDIGWYMDCNLGAPYDAGGGVMGGFVFGNPAHPGTYLKDIHGGLIIYLNSRFNNAGAGWITGTAGKAFAAGSNRSGAPAQAFGQNGSAAAFGQVMDEISHNRTLLLTFKHWNINPAGGAGGIPTTGQTNTESDFGGMYYEWGSTPTGPNAENEVWNGDTNGTALGHVVTAVGFIAAGSSNDMWQAAGLAGPTDWVIVHDNWASTPRNVIIPFDFANNWVANTIALPGRGPVCFTNIGFVDGTHLRIGFTGIPGTMHDLLGINGLQTTNAWSVDMSNIVFSPGTIWITNAIPPAAAQRFYRVRANY
ncbi:MAG: hypothetical protein ABSA45_07455 [Verrucomicrobiota bacterium]|jgi:hypothetical protein